MTRYRLKFYDDYYKDDLNRAKRKGVDVMFCIDCPVKGTQFCHIANPKAKKYTRAEKKLIRHRIDNGELKEWETSEESVEGIARSVIYAAMIKEAK